MTEFSMLPWETQSGTGDGAFSYNQDQSNNFFRQFDVRNVAQEGVAWGVGSNLALTGSSSPLVVADGAAVCYGRYWNDANANLSLITPAADTGGRVILRTDWAANQTRLAVIYNSVGVTTPPALTQVAGTTWEIALASFVIDNAGNVWTDATKTVAGVTDERYPILGGYTSSEQLLYRNPSPTTMNDCVISGFVIPSWVNGLIIRGAWQQGHAGNDYTFLQFNGDTGNNYQWGLHEVAYTAGAWTFLGATTTNQLRIAHMKTSAFTCTFEALVMNVQDTTAAKPVKTSYASAVSSAPVGGFSGTGGGGWASSAALRTLSISSLNPGGVQPVYGTTSIYGLV